ncbi:MAG TPA: YihY/virulence factor BrkB family protein, partial [Nitrospira sp.]|nr:YihY/virulence factor BrkB family protein [Nitrospira sp.]
ERLVNARRQAALLRLLVRHALVKFGRDNGLFLAGGLAFSLLLYSVPLTLIMISLLGYTVLESDQAMEEVQSVLRRFLPRSEQVFTDNVAAIVTDRGLLGAVGFGSFLVFSTMVFGSIQHVLNIVFEAGPGRGRWRGTAHDLVMMVFCMALLAATVGVASLFAVFNAFGESLSGTGPFVGWAVGMAQKLASLVLGVSLIFGLYRFSPARTLAARSLVVGSLVTVLLFELAKQAFAWYVGFAQAHVALYGVLGAFVFFFLWLYYASAVFVLGAEVGMAHEQVVISPRSA